VFQSLFSPMLRLLLITLLSLVSLHAQNRKGISVGEPPADHSPAAELASFKVLDGFEVNLFASEDDGIPNPIAIRWDERGRLWVLQTSVYPQPTPEEVPNDKIIILEDTDHDGRADKRTTFADGLCQPMGLELAPAANPKGHSVYVGEGEKLWLFHDDDGDDQVDRREVILSGFGTGDTHQSINSFIWAPDGALVMHQGLHCYSKVVTAWGVKKLYGAGFWHYYPKSGKLEAYPTGMPLNAWGTAFTDDGEPMMVAGAAGMYWSKPMQVSTSDTDVRGGNDGAKDAQVHGIPHFLIERFQLPYGGQCIKTEGLTKYCGVDISGNSHWPANMQGELITGGFFDNKVYRYQLRPDPEFTCGIEAIEQPALITSDNVAFRPIDIRFGPEGALYIADWYDPIIGHYQASFRHPNRDRQHGRIWRVVAKGRDKVIQPKLTDLNPKKVMPSVFKMDRWEVYQKARLFRELFTECVLTKDKVSFSPGKSKPVMLVGGSNPPLDPIAKPKPANAPVHVPSVTFRLQTGEWKPEEKIGFLRTANSLESVSYDFVISCLESSDNNLRAMAVQCLGTFTGQISDAIKAIQKSTADESPRVRLEAVIAAAKLNDIRTALKVLDKPIDSYIERALWLAVHATASQWKPLKLDFIKDMSAAQIAFVVKKEGSADTKAAAEALLKQSDLPATVREGLTQGLAKDGGASTGLTAAETERLKQAGKDSASLKELATSRTASAKLKEAAMTAWIAADPKAAAEATRQSLNEAKTLAAMRSLLAHVLPVDAAARAFTESLKAKPCSADAAKLVLRVLTSTGRNDVSLTAVLTSILGANSQVPSYDPAWINTLAAEVKAQGNATTGKTVFASTLTNCVACHAIGKQGGTIGPELDAVGRGVPMELLIEAVVWPNRQIKEGYIATTVNTKDGRTLTGYKVSDANGNLQLRDFTAATIHQLQATDIATRTDSGSLMPEGLVALMTREELRDLIAYLSSLGR
jgi:putative membrane-bound dehydrogenase-like protein